MVGIGLRRWLRGLDALSAWATLAWSLVLGISPMLACEQVYVRTGGALGLAVFAGFAAFALAATVFAIVVALAASDVR
jgi:hypothetical protein